MDRAAELPARTTFEPTRLIRRVASSQIVRRLVQSLLVGFGVMVIAFALLRFIPGDPVQILLGDAATPELVEAYRQDLGLNGTLPEQFVTYLSNVLRGDLGKSLQTRASVNSIIARTLPVTLWLIVVTVVFALVLSLPLAVLAALN